MLFKDNHQDLQGLCVPLGRGVPVWKEVGQSPKEGILFETQK